MPLRLRELCLLGIGLLIGCLGEAPSEQEGVPTTGAPRLRARADMRHRLSGRPHQATRNN